jgi:hypothetical protein
MGTGTRLAALTVVAPHLEARISRGDRQLTISVAHRVWCLLRNRVAGQPALAGSAHLLRRPHITLTVGIACVKCLVCPLCTVSLVDGRPASPLSNRRAATRPTRAGYTRRARTRVDGTRSAELRRAGAQKEEMP